MAKKSSRKCTVFATSHGVSIPYDQYAGLKLQFSANAYEKRANKFKADSEKDGTIAADMAAVGEIIENLKEQGFDHFVAAKRGEATPKDAGRDKVLDEVYASARKSWQKNSRECLEIEAEVWRSQWDDLMSDLWRRERNYRLILRKLRQKFPEHSAFAVAWLELSSEVSNEVGGNISRAFKAIAKALSSQPAPNGKTAPQPKEGAKSSPILSLERMAEDQKKIVSEYGKALENVVGDKAAREWAAAFGSELYMIGGKNAMKQIQAAQLVHDTYEERFGEGSFAVIYNVNKLRSEISKRTSHAKK